MNTKPPAAVKAAQALASLRRLAAAADSTAIDDAAFRALAARGLARVIARLDRDDATVRANRRQRYKYITVLNDKGESTSVAFKRAEFVEMAKALGGEAAVRAEARRVALAYRTDMAESRSSYVARHVAASAKRAKPPKR